MRVVVRADDGDQITVNADDLATEQRIVRLELQNLAFDDISEFDSVSLTVERAHELASALLTIADAVEEAALNLKPLSDACAWDSLCGSLLARDNAI